VQLVEVVGTDMTSDDGAQHTITPVGTVIGTLTEAAMPNEVTFCISLRSAARGRSARGRTYVLAVTREAITANTLLSARADQFKADLQALIDDMATAGTPMAIVSYRHDNAPRVGGPVYYQVLTATWVDLIVDSMKRRKPGVGA